MVYKIMLFQSKICIPVGTMVDQRLDFFNVHLNVWPLGKYFVEEEKDGHKDEDIRNKDLGNLLP